MRQYSLNIYYLSDTFLDAGIMKVTRINTISALVDPIDYRRDRLSSQHKKHKIMMVTSKSGASRKSSLWKRHLGCDLKAT